MTENKQVLGTARCWRCSGRKVQYEVEKLEDGTEIGFYACLGCRTQWMAMEDAMPYFVKLRQQIRELAGSNPILQGKEIPANMSKARPT